MDEARGVSCIVRIHAYHCENQNKCEGNLHHEFKGIKHMEEFKVTTHRCHYFREYLKQPRDVGRFHKIIRLSRKIVVIYLLMMLISN